MGSLGCAPWDVAASSGIGRRPTGLERVLAGFALAIALALPCTAAPTIDALTVRPGYFTPDGDGITDTAEVSFIPGGAAGSVIVRVEVRRDVDDVLVSTPTPAASFPVDETVTSVWSPGPIAEGAYRFEVLVVDAADSAFAEGFVIADTTNPQVSLGAIAPNPFDPASAPPGNVITVPFTVVSDSTTATLVSVLTAAGAFVDSLGVQVGPATGQFTWDGRAADSSAAPSGPYRVRALATDLAGNADSTLQSFVLDREAPVFVGVADSLQTSTLPFLLTGSATDVDRVTAVTISVDGGSTYVAVDSMDPPGPSVNWSTSVSPGGTPGFFELQLRATDALAHVREQTVVLAYDTQFPVPVASFPLGGGTVTDGELIRIQTEWNLSGLDVSANFSPLDFAFSPGDETVREGPAGTYVISYEVSPENIRSAGTKQIEITASTGILTAQDSVAVVLVDAGPRDSELVAINRNRFNPEANETVTIAAERSTFAVIVDIYNLAGHLVRHLAEDGAVEWDGRNEAGAICGSGVYILHVTADEEEETRHVAVMRTDVSFPDGP